jgi:hypothetical protein
MIEMNRDFSFVDNDRTFTCRIEASRPRVDDAWWWFEVSTERHQRHAPFRAAGNDTPDAIRERVVAYYDELLARRAAPPQTRWSRRTPVTPAPAVESALPPA